MKAVVTAEFTDEGIRALEALGCSVVRTGWGLSRQSLAREALIEQLDGAEILVCELENVDEHVLDACPNLRLIASCRGNPTNVDVVGATRHGVLVTNTPARNAASVADYTVGLTLSLIRNIALSERHLRDSGWKVGNELPYFHFRGPELEELTLGVVGFGAIGKMVARRFHAGFGMHVLVFDPYVEVVDRAFERADLSELMKGSDIVSIHAPASSETRGLIGHEELGLLGTSGYVVNTARAEIVDETALVAALNDGTIKGAALDVFWEEPLSRDHPLLKMDNVVITPHVAGAADDVRRHQSSMVVDDVRAFNKGRRPARLVNPEAWEVTIG
jgi:D-3-phosphoglycerate dehydrogenase